MEEPTEEWSLLERVPPTCALPNHNQKHKQLDGPTCKGKKPTAPNKHTHTFVHDMGADAQFPPMNGPLVRGGGDERDGTVSLAALPQPGTKTHLHRGDCLHKLFICWVTWFYFTSTQVLKCTSVWLASSLRVIFGDNFSPFDARGWLQKMLRLQTSSGVQINAHPRENIYQFSSIFSLQNTIFFCLRVYTVECSL